MRLSALVLLVACTPDEPPTRPGAAAPTTLTSTTGSTTGTTHPSALVCAEPDRRTERHYDRLELPGTVTGTSGLIGVGVVAADFDGDGWPDLFLPGQTESQLFRGTGDPTAPFADHSDWLADLDLDLAVGGTAVDLDEDGRLDLVVTRWQHPNLLLRNAGDRFEDITPGPWSAVAWRTQSATAADLDNDGDLDLFFGSYGDRPVNSNDPDMAPADPAELYRNDGGGSWTDLSATLSPEVHDAYTFAAGFYDVDGDGVLEGFLANDFGLVRPSVRLDNLGALQLQADTSWHPESEDMALGAGDVNRDGVPDFLITSAVEILVLQSGEASGVPGRWVESGGAWGIRVEPVDKNQYFGWGADWGDLDNDADLDAVALFGHWSDWPTVTGQLDAVWVQVASDPPLFEERAADPLWSLDDDGPGRGLALVDLNRDGWLDVAKREVGEDHVVHLSRCGTEHWLEVDLRAPPPNTHGVGAVVTVEVDGSRQTRWITAGGSGLFGGGPPIAHFGLGSAAIVDSVEILWPDGHLDRFEAVPSSRRLTASRTE